MTESIKILCDADLCNKIKIPRISIAEARYLNREVESYEHGERVRETGVSPRATC